MYGILEIGASSDDIPCIDNCDFAKNRSVIVDVHRRESMNSSAAAAANWGSSPIVVEVHRRESMNQSAAAANWNSNSPAAAVAANWNSNPVTVDVHRRESTKSSGGGNWNSNRHRHYSPERSPVAKSDLSSPIGTGDYIRFKYSPTSSMQSSTVDWMGGPAPGPGPAVCGPMSKSMNAADWNDSGIGLGGIGISGIGLGGNGISIGGSGIGGNGIGGIGGNGIAAPAPKLFQTSQPKRYASLGSRSSDMSSLVALAVPPMCEPPKSPDALAELQVELKAVLSSLETFTQQAKLAKDISPPPPAPYPVPPLKDLKELSLTPDLVQNLPARNGTPTSERSDYSPRPPIAQNGGPAVAPNGGPAVAPNGGPAVAPHGGPAVTPDGGSAVAPNGTGATQSIENDHVRIRQRFSDSRPPSQELTAAEKFAQSRDGTLKKAAVSASTPDGIAYAVTAIPNLTQTPPDQHRLGFAASSMALSLSLSKGEKPPVAPKPRRSGSPVPGRKYRPAKEFVEISKM